MIQIVTYPKRLFDRMVKDHDYSEKDYFISIGHSHAFDGDEPTLPESANYLRLEYDDILHDVVLGSKGISMQQAEEVVKFTEKIVDGVVLHIHCQAGQSRSTGTAIAAGQILNIKGYSISYTHFGEEFHPNVRVSSMIMEAWHIKNKKRK